MYLHLLEHRNRKGVICNNSNQHVKLLKKQKLDIISEFFFENYFSTNREADTAKIPLIKLSLRDNNGVIVIAPDPLLET